MASSGEGLESPGKRRTLGIIGAGGLIVAGIRPEDAEAAFKNKNDPIEIEKKLLYGLSKGDTIEKINSATITDMEDFVRDKYRKRFREVMVGAGAILAAGVAGGLVADHARQHGKDQKDYLGTLFGTAFSAIIAGVIIDSQPNSEYVGAAEQSLIGWIIQERQAENVISRESIAERIENLTKLQKTNSARVSEKK